MELEDGQRMDAAGNVVEYNESTQAWEPVGARPGAEVSASSEALVEDEPTPAKTRRTKASE